VWRSRRSAAAIRGLLGQLIRPRFDAHRAGKPSDTTDILQSFLDAKNEATGDGFGFDELLDQVAMLFLAGHETSASALTWAAYLMANAPDIQERMHQEVVMNLADRQPELLDMRYLELVRNVFRETLRLFPPVGFMARQSSAACPMHKKEIEKAEIELTCVICLANKKSMVFVDCGHFSVCFKCSKQCTKCPICSKTSKNVLKVYLS
jgi:cytochrome P450